jgi:DNA repair protein RadC
VAIAICHNHPSGQNFPSNEDNALTRRINIAAKTMDIRLIDHVIITDGNYFSYADEGRLD